MKWWAYAALVAALISASPAFAQHKEAQSLTVLSVHPELDQIVGEPATGGQPQTVLFGPDTKLTRRDAPDRALELRELSPGDHVLVHGVLSGDRVTAERVELLSKPPAVGSGRPR